MKSEAETPDPLAEPAPATAGDAVAAAGPVRLWGGRFESGPAEALARLSVSVQFD